MLTAWSIAWFDHRFACRISWCWSEAPDKSQAEASPRNAEHRLKFIQPTSRSLESKTSVNPSVITASKSSEKIFRLLQFSQLHGRKSRIIFRVPALAYAMANPPPISAPPIISSTGCDTKLMLEPIRADDANCSPLRLDSSTTGPRVALSTR